MSEAEVIPKAEAITLEDAEKVLAEEMKSRVAECQRDIEIALKAHRCRLEPYTIVRRGEVAQGFEIVADG